MAIPDLGSMGKDIQPETALAGTGGLTAEWLNAALTQPLGTARVTAVEVTPIGTGQVSASARLAVSYDKDIALPASFVAKVPSASETSRTAARTMRTYEVEARFYAQLSPATTAHVPTCFHVGYDSARDSYVVLLEDLSPAEPGDQLAGISVADATAAIDELATFHASFWAEPALADLRWLNRSRPETRAFVAEMLGGLFAGFRARYANELDPATLDLIAAFEPRLLDYLNGQPAAVTVTHSDFRADNLLFGGSRVAIVDWQTASYGAGACDVAYLLGSSLSVSDRRAHEENLVRRYHARLLGLGVNLGWDDCWSGYCRFACQGLLTAIGASMMVERTDRGDEMFRTMATRHATHARDLDALSLVD